MRNFLLGVGVGILIVASAAYAVVNRPVVGVPAAASPSPWHDALGPATTAAAEREPSIPPIAYAPVPIALPVVVPVPLPPPPAEVREVVREVRVEVPNPINAGLSRDVGALKARLSDAEALGRANLAAERARHDLLASQLAAEHARVEGLLRRRIVELCGAR